MANEFIDDVVSKPGLQQEDTNQEDGIGRRVFLKQGLAFGAALAFGGGILGIAEKAYAGGGIAP